MTRFIGIASAKGGTGKTTTAINLGAALANFGRNVMVVDYDLAAPNLSLHLGISQLPTSLHSIAKQDKPIREASYLHPSGLKVIPGSIAIGDSSDTDYEKINEKISQLKGAAEAVIVDCAPSLGKDFAQTLKSVTELLVVTTPDLPAVTDTLKTIHEAEEQGITVLGCVVTQQHSDAYELTIDNIEKLLEQPVISTIPYDDTVRHSVKIKHPVVYSHPACKASIAYKKLAGELIGERFFDKL